MPLFLTNPQDSLKKLMETFETYKRLAGLKINYEKSEILPLGQQKKQMWKNQTPFALAHEKIKYLGINIGKTPSSVYNLNITSIDKVIKELQAWKEIPLTLFGRIHLYRMTSFPKLLYPLQTIPLLLQTKDTKRLNKTLTQFIWRNKKPRIAMNKLWLPKCEGGMNLPNAKLYNLSCMLRHTIDWMTVQSKFTNFDLETAMVQPWTLLAVLHWQPKALPVELKQNILIKDTITTWRQVRRK